MVYQENLNAERINQLIKPLVISGIYKNNESALKVIIIEFIKNKQSLYKAIIDKFENKHKVGIEEFTANIKNRASHIEEDDCIDWKAALEMKKAWVEALKEMIQNADNY